MRKYYEWRSGGLGPGKTWHIWYAIIESDGILTNVDCRGRAKRAIFDPIKTPDNWRPVKRCTMLRTYREFGIKLEAGL